MIWGLIYLVVAIGLAVLVILAARTEEPVEDRAELMWFGIILAVAWPLFLILLVGFAAGFAARKGTRWIGRRWRRLRRARS